MAMIRSAGGGPILCRTQKLTAFSFQSVMTSADAGWAKPKIATAANVLPVLSLMENLHILAAASSLRRPVLPPIGRLSQPDYRTCVCIAGTTSLFFELARMRLMWFLALC